MYFWAKSSFLTFVILILIILVWEKGVTEVLIIPKEKPSFPQLYCLLKEEMEPTKEWLDICDEKPLLINTVWNYSPSLPSLKIEKQLDYRMYTNGINTLLQQPRKPIYAIPTAQEFVKTDNIEERFWTYYGRDFLASHKQISIDKSIDIRWIKNGKIVHQKKVALPIQAKALGQPCEGLMLFLPNTETFYWENATDNEEINSWMKNHIITETKSNREVFKNPSYKIWIEASE